MIAFYESDFMCWLNVKTGRYAFMMLREWQNTDKTIKIFPESSRAQHSVIKIILCHLFKTFILTRKFTTDSILKYDI